MIRDILYIPDKIKISGYGTVPYGYKIKIQKLHTDIYGTGILPVRVILKINKEYGTSHPHSIHQTLQIFMDRRNQQNTHMGHNII